MRALVIGGTGPTGHFMVNGLIDRGFKVAILHTGRHEVDEIPPEVEHIHTDPFSTTALASALRGRTFDVLIATYGRLRRIAELTRDHTEQFISIGGVPAYSGYMNAPVWSPAGLPVPTAEDAPLVQDEAEDAKGWRIVRTEERVFDQHPDAIHFRYPIVYGKYQLAPREWCIVRRLLDGRRRMIVPDDGLSLYCHGYAGNLAHAVLLAVDQADRARGKIFNVGDVEQLTLRQIIEIIAAALGREIELVSMPNSLALPARPLLAQPWSTHRVMDLTLIRSTLGYEDAWPPREALASVARWLAANPPEPGGTTERILHDPFDYAAEDRLMDQWEQAVSGIELPKFHREPGFSVAYSGPGGKARRSEWTG